MVKDCARAFPALASVAAVAFAATPLSRAFLYKLCILVNYRLGVSSQGYVSTAVRMELE